MNTQILFNPEALLKLQKGVDNLANAVRVTMGPKGRTVVFRGNFVDDGVTIAKNIEFKDPVEKMGADLIKRAAENTDRDAGDGTTAATILCQEILKEGLKAIGAGMDVIQLKKGMAMALDIIKKNLDKMAQKVKSKVDIKNVAIISSRDEEIGEKVAEVMEKAGKDAVVSVEEVKTIGLESEVVEGLQFEQGYISPYMITNPNAVEANIEEPFILISNQNIRTNQDIVPLLERVKSAGKNLVLIANEISGEALSTCVVNKLRGIQLTLGVKAPGIGDDKDGQLQDIAIMTGATFISEETGIKVEDAEIEQLGKADRVVSTSTTTVIIGGKGNKTAIKKRIAELEKMKKQSELDYERDKLIKRIAKLKGGVAVIRIGTISVEENREKRYRIEDAVRSAQSAIEEGIVPGGGMALIKCSNKVKEVAKKETDLDLRTGMMIVANAAREPARQILENSGENADVILYQIESKPENWGYDSDKKRMGNLLEMGIIDPKKVVRVGIEQAVSIVGLFLTTECVIADEPEEDKSREKK